MVAWKVRVSILLSYEFKFQYEVSVIRILHFSFIQHYLIAFQPYVLTELLSSLFRLHKSWQRASSRDNMLTLQSFARQNKRGLWENFVDFKVVKTANGCGATGCGASKRLVPADEANKKTCIRYNLIKARTLSVKKSNIDKKKDESKKHDKKKRKK